MANLKKVLMLLLFLLMPVFSSRAEPIASVRPWLGVAIEKGQQGVLVKSTFPDTPAAQAGLRSGDEIMKVVGVAVRTPEEMIQEVTNKGVGFTIKIDFVREGKNLSKDITLVAMPDMLSLTKQKLIQHKTPDFDAIVVQGPGTKFQMKKQMGKVTLLDFWATWCMACNATIPRLTQFALKHKDKIDVISISGEEVPVIKKFLARLEARIPKNENQIIYLQSDEGTVNNLFMASAIPMFVLIDKNGVVVDVDLGGGSILENILSKAEALLKP